MPLPWTILRDWSPFQIDALGLVTLLGAEEVSAAVGRLVPSKYLEYFPLLGAFVIAGDRFKEKNTSFNIYNITQGVHTTDMACWLTRWMLAQDFEKNRSIVHFEVADKPRSVWKDQLLAGSISFVFTGFLLVMTILSEDWYGIANVIAMVISIIVRSYILGANRRAIDEAINAAETNPSFRNAKGDKKCMVVMSDSKAVTLEIPGHLIIDVFIDNPKPNPEWIYHIVRYVGWAAFAIHVLSIGQSKLANQLYTIVLMLLPTILMCWKLGCDDSKWKEEWRRLVDSSYDKPTNYTCWFGTRLKAHVFQWPLEYEFVTNPKFGVGLQHNNPNLEHNPSRNKWYRLQDKKGRDRVRRQDLYAWLNLTEDELESMGKWDLFPHERGHNQQWWNDYKVKHELIQDGIYHLDVMRDKISSQTQSNGVIPASPAVTAGNGRVFVAPSEDNNTTTTNSKTDTITTTTAATTSDTGHHHNSPPQLHLRTNNLSRPANTNASNSHDSFAMDSITPQGIVRSDANTNTNTNTNALLIPESAISTATDTVLTPDGRLRRFSVSSQQ